MLLLALAPPLNPEATPLNPRLGGGPYFGRSSEGGKGRFREECRGKLHAAIAATGARTSGLFSRRKVAWHNVSHAASL